MFSNFQKVKEFHDIFKQPVGKTPNANNLNYERENLRNGFIIEEFCELLEAQGYNPKAIAFIEFAWEQVLNSYGNERVKDPDIVEIADALADLAYFNYGSAVEYGIDLDYVLKEVHASNLSKLDENGNVLYREDGKVLKGPNFFKPNISKILETQENLS